MSFRSDNTAGASEKVLAALIAANGGTQSAYGTDTYTLKAEKALCEVFERDLAVFLVATGTAANALALSALTPPWGAVLCHAEAHIAEDECGAPEFFSGGAKIVGLPGTGCKLVPDVVAGQLARMPASSVHSMQPAALSISQATEAGTIYTPAEVGALAEVARGRGLGLHMDGARFANALVALGCTPAEITWKAGVDVLSFGATKNGCLAAEAVILFDQAKAKEMAFRRKRAGQTLSKGRFLAAQLGAYLEGGHWLDLARRANEAAQALERALLTLPGVRLGWPRQANEVFAIIPDAVDRELRAAGMSYHPWSPLSLPSETMPRQGEAIYRFVASFRTTSLDIEAVGAAGRRLTTSEERAKDTRVRVKR